MASTPLLTVARGAHAFLVRVWDDAPASEDPRLKGMPNLRASAPSRAFEISLTDEELKALRVRGVPPGVEEADWLAGRAVLDRVETFEGGAERYRLMHGEVCDIDGLTCIGFLRRDGRLVRIKVTEEEVVKREGGLTLRRSAIDAINARGLRIVGITDGVLTTED